MGKLLEKMTEEGKLVEGELDGPHWEDQWWIGAKSYVRNTLYTGVILRREYCSDIFHDVIR